MWLSKDQLNYFNVHGLWLFEFYVYFLEKYLSINIKYTIRNKILTYDFERLMEGATLRKCSEFAQDIIDNM
ncbi:hypothetical protein EXT53_12310 [Pectobacterium polaris]|uniref:Uncharacterized protein n=1 Tax=Pectobacterium polaris TaxID=2042057 RepID=A0AAW5GFA1_9GAMM|nr:hypothetical protein [Pectobacterium polaris]MCL6369343.1 hypothetical protein [Pectobacterium polaris]